MVPPPFPSHDPQGSQVCKYFLAGNCKFGKSCRFLHIRNSPNAPPTQPQGPQKQPVGQPVSMEDLVRFDLGQIQNVWPYSCYGITNNWAEGGNILTGEFSPEELRVEAYHQMKSSQNIQNYIAQVTQMRAMFESKKAALIENPKLALQEMQSHRLHPLPPPALHTPTPPFKPHETHAVLPASPHHQQPQIQQIHQTQPNIPPPSTVNSSFEFGKIPENLPPSRRI
jgi:hypothetical protein